MNTPKSYAAQHMADRVLTRLAGEGYVIYCGDGYNTTIAGKQINSERFAYQTYDKTIDGYWFTWAGVGTDIEVGETFETEFEAWGDAMEHFFDNASIPTFQTEIG